MHADRFARAVRSGSVTRVVFAALAWSALLLAPGLGPGVARAQFGGLDKGTGGLPDLTAPAEDPDRPEVIVEGASSAPRVAPGGELVVAIVLDHAPSWHTWPSADQDVLPASVAEFAIRTAVVPTAETRPGWIERTGAIQWPEPKEVANPLGDPPTVKSYAGRAVAYLPVLVAPDAEPGPRALALEVSFQACDDTVCLAPTTETVTVAVEVVPLETLGEIPAMSDGDFAGFDPRTFARLRAEPDAPGLWGGPAEPGAGAGVAGGSGGGVGGSGGGAGPSFFGFQMPELGGAGGAVILALLAALGGFILNLTPCVLPVIPLKIMTISQHAQSPGKSLALGLWMALGVVAFWVGIGLPAAFLTAFVDPSRLFGIWWVTAGIGLLIAVLAVGLMGAFEIRLPRALYAVEPRADSAWGSFLFGVMTAVLGLPCFGFVAGALLAGAATMPTWEVLTIFTSIGVGMAAPYLVLSANPRLLSKMPKAGPASDLVKQVMGLLLLAAGAYFAGAGALAAVQTFELGPLPWWGKVVHWWFVALFAVLAGGWLLVRTVAITKSLLRRSIFAVVGVILGGAAVAYASSATIAARDDFWIPYSPELLADARADGDVVVLDFTAEWCLNCKALKARYLNVDPVKSELLAGDVTPMIVDLTADAAPGWDKLDQLGFTGIPLLVIYGPGFEGDEFWSANAYTGNQVLRGLARARGEGGTDPAPDAEAEAEFSARDDG
mgnify:FL=1